MRAIYIRRIGASALLVWGMAGAAQAQSQATAAKVEVTRAADLVETVPDEEKLERTRDAIDKMRQKLSKVLRYLEEAREERDVLKVNCVNEKLTAIKGLLRISEQADVALQEALYKRNVSEAQHKYETVVIASRKCDQLLAEAEVCVGELAVYAGETSVDIEIDQSVGGAAQAVVIGGMTDGEFTPAEGDDSGAVGSGEDLVSTDGGEEASTGSRPPEASPFQ